MAKKTKQNILISQVNVKPVNRESLDIQKWRSAHKTAESTSKNRKQLYEIFDEILLDAHLSSVIEKRQNSITNLQLKFFDKNNKDVEEMDAIINTTYFEEMLKELINAKFWGFSLLELDWSPVEGYQNKTYLIDRRHVKPEMGVVVPNPSDATGIDYLEHPFALFAGGTGLGVLLKACPMVIYKRNNTGDWGDYNELFGKPYPQGKYANDDTRLLLTEAFEKAGFDAYMVAPNDAEITLHMPNGGSSNGNFKDLRDAMNEELSILILGQNLTSKVTGGSFAASQTHMEVEESIHTADREFVVKHLNEKLVPILQRLGYKADGSFQFVYMDEVSLIDRIEIDSKVANMVPVADDYFYETYNIPKPTGKSTKQSKSTDEKLSIDKPESFLTRLFFKKKKVSPF
jgi:phage gp29-like protein